MQFVTYVQDGKQHVGLFTQEQRFIVPLAAAEKHFLGSADIPDDMQAIIEAGDDVVAKIKALAEKAAADKNFPLVAAEAVTVLAPIPRPKKNIFCIGKNYVEHALEFDKTGDASTAVPKHPVVFTKPPTAVVGPGTAVKNHQDVTSQLDYEVELAVVIGKTASKVSKADAYDYVFGYTIMNDVTARDLQKRHIQWFLGKGLDTFAPLGPCLVHKSAIPDPHNLNISCKINGEIRQNANTRDMVFDIPTLIEVISAGITLEPGDIIATGTPSGVGAGFNPPKFLKSGDVMELEIEGIGILKNTIE
ncbi:5-carboxymethyl-2-hydroxymuconate delta-isomerase [Thermosinus carboxydivorans Nor1]|uniref:5-carboxymethyl-2-hydroxymuconate delta-isomerase n=1 Tax=Thermosinus carboxydivorans Nor1 TaxID=401526 RepID=A1HMS9_9FIRM|nr:fumarylacetoacetate hydrolase family protein [Thermosinus carboxydivorans]EAX48565.1 5-carboxymethyl-2-hydroxymuconate delta-isomerase [Thermosinus carboxydivorans Nor1]